MVSFYVNSKRLEFKWSQADLATKIGNNYQNISRLERGEISPTLFWCYKLLMLLKLLESVYFFIVTF